MSLSAHVGARVRGGRTVSAIWVSRRTATAAQAKIECPCGDCRWGFLVKTPGLVRQQWYSNGQFKEIAV